MKTEGFSEKKLGTPKVLRTDGLTDRWTGWNHY